MDMHQWTCDACGQRIDAAEEGWVSWVERHGAMRLLVVHHASASPWAPWGGCYPLDELASLHLHEALDLIRDESGTQDGLRSPDSWNLTALEGRMRHFPSNHAAAARAFAER
jgi:hypothetical protein